MAFCRVRSGFSDSTGTKTSAALYELVKTNPYAPRLASVRNVMALPGAVAFKAHSVMGGALGIGGAPGGAAQPRGASGQGFGYGPELLDEMTTTTVLHLGLPGTA